MILCQLVFVMFMRDIAECHKECIFKGNIFRILQTINLWLGSRCYVFYLGNITRGIFRLQSIPFLILQKVWLLSMPGPNGLCAEDGTIIIPPLWC